MCGLLILLHGVSAFHRRRLHCAAVQREYIPYFIRAAAARTGFDREEMKGRSCLARLDHPSSLSHRIGKRKAAEAIYLLSHRGGGGGGEGEDGGGGRRERKEGQKTINIKILSIHNNPYVSLSFSSDNLRTKRRASSFRFIRGLILHKKIGGKKEAVEEYE